MIIASSGFRPISEARFIRYGTVADIKMPSGRTFRATYGFRGPCCAWWPAPNQIRRSPIGLYEPSEFRVVAAGMLVHREWEKAVQAQHANPRRAEQVEQFACES